MITRFKIFEKYEEEVRFKEGDYVILSAIYRPKKAQIIKAHRFEGDIGTYIKYTVEFVDSDRIDTMRMNGHDIVRLMKPEEIEEFEISKNLIKYNI